MVGPGTLHAGASAAGHEEAVKRGRAQRVSWEESQGVGFRNCVGAPMGEIVGS